MNKGRSRLWTCLALCVIVWLAAAGLADAGLFGRGGATRKRAPGVRKSLLIFPFDQGDVARLPEEFGEYVASDLRTMLGSGSDYYSYLYKDRLSPIVRAKNDNTLKSTDLDPFVKAKTDNGNPPSFAENREKALKLARLLAGDYILIGTVDDFSVDPKTKVAELTLSAELVDVKTGRLVKMLSATGRSPENLKGSFEDELRDVAKGDAVTKLMAEIVAEPKAEPGVVPGSSTPPAATPPAAAPPAATPPATAAPASGGDKQPTSEPDKKAPADG